MSDNKFILQKKAISLDQSEYRIEEYTLIVPKCDDVTDTFIHNHIVGPR